MGYDSSYGRRPSENPSDQLQYNTITLTVCSLVSSSNLCIMSAAVASSSAAPIAPTTISGPDPQVMAAIERGNAVCFLDVGLGDGPLLGRIKLEVFVKDVREGIERDRQSYLSEIEGMAHRSLFFGFFSVLGQCPKTCENFRQVRQFLIPSFYYTCDIGIAHKVVIVSLLDRAQFCTGEFLKNQQPTGYKNSTFHRVIKVGFLLIDRSHDSEWSG